MHTSSQRFLVSPLRGPLQGELRVPGDKSIGHRAVLLGALGRGVTTLRGLSGGEDNQRTVAVFEALGVPVRREGEVLRIGDAARGPGRARLAPPTVDLDCGNSGTSIRLLCGVLAAQGFHCRLTGDPYLSARPMRRVVDPLRQMGAQLGGAEGKKPGEVYPPLVINPQLAPGEEGAPPRLQGLRYKSPIASAQVKSALLLAGLYAEGDTEIIEPTRSRDHSERMLQALGVPLCTFDEPDGAAGCRLETAGFSRELPPFTLTIPGDLSSAAFLLGAALLSPGSEVRVRGVGLNPSRTGVLDVLAAMAPGAVQIEGARTDMGEPVGDLVVRGGAGLAAVAIGGTLAIRALDELPLCAALAAAAHGQTVISGAAELRVKESDRIAATCALLRAFGVACEERPDGLVVEGRGPGALRPARVESFGDHRIAMAGATLALAAGGESVIEDVGNVATSFPSFASSLQSLGAELRLG